MYEGGNTERIILTLSQQPQKVKSLPVVMYPIKKINSSLIYHI